MPAKKNTFTQQQVPNASPDVQDAVGDIYDKLSAVPGLVNGVNEALAKVEADIAVVKATKATGTNPSVKGPGGGSGGTSVIPATSIEGATGRALSPQYAYIPNFTALPNPNPTTGLPYAQDGELIGDGLVLYRYRRSTTKFEHVGALREDDVRLFGVVADGTTDDTAAMKVALSSPLTSLYLPSTIAIKNSSNVGSSILPGVPGSPYALTIPSGMTLHGPGGFIGLDSPSSFESTTQIIIQGVTNGSPVAFGTPIAVNTSNFTVANTFAVDDMLMLSNFPTAASDAFTTIATGQRCYAAGSIGSGCNTTDPTNLRQTRRREPCMVATASGSAFTLHTPTVYAYPSTTQLQFQKITPAEAITFDGVSFSGIFISVDLARDFTLKGGNHKSSTISIGRSLFVSVEPDTWNSTALDAAVAIGGSSRFFEVRGKYFSGSASADNGAVRVDQASNGLLDFVATGEGGSFYGCIIDTNYFESPDGYTDVPTNNLDIRMVVSKASLTIFMSCDPFHAPIYTTKVNIVASGGGQAQIGGVIDCDLNHQGLDCAMYLIAVEKMRISGTCASFTSAPATDPTGAIGTPKLNLDVDLDGFRIVPTTTGLAGGFPNFFSFINLKLSALIIDMRQSLDVSGNAGYFNTVTGLYFGAVSVYKLNTQTLSWGQTGTTGDIRVLGELETPFAGGWPAIVSTFPSAISVTGSVNPSGLGVVNANQLQTVPISATSPSVGDVLTDVGGVWTPQAPAASGVTSFNTRTGAVTLTSTDIQLAGGAIVGAFGTPVVVPLAKLTVGGTDGSITFNSLGVAYAVVNPT